MTAAERMRRLRERRAVAPSEDPALTARRKKRNGEELTDADKAALREYNARAARLSRQRRKAEQ